MSKTIVQLASEMSKSFVWKKRENGDDFVCLVDDRPEWMVDIVRSIHGDKLPDDTVYHFIESACDYIADMEDDTPIETIQGGLASFGCEPDVYTSDLTAWLNKSNDHVFYLTEVLEELDIKDGFQALAAAQQRQREEIAFSLLNELEQLVEKEKAA